VPLTCTISPQLPYRTAATIATTVLAQSGVEEQRQDEQPKERSLITSKCLCRRQRARSMRTVSKTGAGMHIYNSPWLLMQKHLL
jgi:hypothetical protein